MKDEELFNLSEKYGKGTTIEEAQKKFNEDFNRDVIELLE